MPNFLQYFIGQCYDNGNQVITTMPVATGVTLAPGDLVTLDLAVGGGKIKKLTDIATEMVVGVVDWRCTDASYLVDPANGEQRYTVFIEGNICIEEPAGFDAASGFQGAKLLRTGLTFLKKNPATGVDESVDGLVIKLM